MTRTRDNTAVLCLMALLAMSTTIISCHAAGTTKMCVRAKTCAPTPPPNYDGVCKLYCRTQGYDIDASYCTAEHGGTCCCVRK
ncbi:unnamed protein product [Triticum turgidum subsp. durum]|uniref:Defensin n=2 Tax=Triticum TaxID=4564 RepID=A0A9R1B896_TRITD|nr:unnamed protein product [Triticum turgidum subsp. durum]